MAKKNAVLVEKPVEESKKKTNKGEDYKRLYEVDGIKDLDEIAKRMGVSRSNVRLQLLLQRVDIPRKPRTKMLSMTQAELIKFLNDKENGETMAEKATSLKVSTATLIKSMSEHNIELVKTYRKKVS